MYLLPFAERLLEFSSAPSSFPGQVPTQEVNSAAEENLLAVTPTSASPAELNRCPDRALPPVVSRRPDADFMACGVRASMTTTIRTF
jgi:hypothetical protein